MSVFTSGETNPPVNNVQGDNQGNGNQLSFMDQLVGDGKKFSDVEALAKGKMEADQHIHNLEMQVKALTDSTAKNDYAKELIDQLQNNKAAAPNTASDVVPPNNNTNVSTEPANTPSGLSEDDLRSLVTKTLAEQKGKEVADSNLRAVDAKLTEKFGTEANARIEKKAMELGMTKDRLQAIAAESPTAFFTLIGEPTQMPNNPIINGSVRTDSVVQNTSERNFNYYQDMRRKDPKMFNSPAMQAQQMDDAVRLGDKFYN